MKLSLALQLLLATHVAAGNANNDETAAKTKGGFLRGSDDKLPPAGRELAGTCPCFGATDLAGQQTNRCNFFDNGNIYVSLQDGAFFVLGADNCSYSGGDYIQNIPAEDKAACVDVLQEACYPSTPAPTPEPTPTPTPDPCSNVECGLGYTCAAGLCVAHESPTSFLREDTYYVISIPFTNKALTEVGQGQITTELDDQMDVVTQIPVLPTVYDELPKDAYSHWRFSAKREEDTYVSYEIINRYTGRRMVAESFQNTVGSYNAYTVQPPTNLNDITGCPCFQAEHLEGETEYCRFHAGADFSGSVLIRNGNTRDTFYFSSGTCGGVTTETGLSHEESEACYDLLNAICPSETLTDVTPVGFEFTTAELDLYGFEENSYYINGLRYIITEVDGYLPRDHFPDTEYPEYNEDKSVKSEVLGFASDLLLTSAFNGIAAFGFSGALGSALLSTTYNTVFGEDTSLDDQLEALGNRISAQFTAAIAGSDLQNGLDSSHY